MSFIGRGGRGGSQGSYPGFPSSGEMNTVPFPYMPGDEGSSEEAEGGGPGGGGFQSPASPPSGPARYTAGANFEIGAGSTFITRPQASPNILTTWKTKDPNVIGWQINFRSFSDGLDRQAESIIGQYVSGRLASTNGVDARWPNSLILSPLVSTATSPDPTGADIMSSCQVWDGTSGITNIYAAGSGANVSLYRTSSASSPAPDVYTYSPGSVINCVEPIIIATPAERLLVGRRGAAAQILSGLSVDAITTDATMHANTAEMWWFATSPLNAATPGAGTHIFNAGTTIYSLSTTAATGDAPTSVLTNWNGGGFKVGLLDIPGFRPSIYVVQPRTDLNVSLTAGAPGHIYGLNLEGTDPQRVKLSIPIVFEACAWPESPWGPGIVATDTQTTVFWNGTSHDLRLPYEREPTTERYIRPRSFAVRGRDLYALMEEFDETGTDIDNHWVEQYIPEIGEWFQVTAKIASSGSAYITDAHGSLPVAQFHGTYQQQYLYWNDDADWRWIPLGAPNRNPFYMNRNTGSSTTGLIYEYATSGSFKTPIYRFMEGIPKVVSGMWFGGELTGTGSQIEIEVATQGASSMSFTSNKTATFKTADRWDRHWATFPNNMAAFDRLQLQVTLTQATSGTGASRTTPQGVPFSIRGYAFLDGRIRKPETVKGEDGWFRAHR